MIKMQITIKTEQEELKEIMAAIEKRREENKNKPVDYERVTGA